ncbi:AAA family ATPase [Acidiplasma aeolicum]|jgi:exonuclease SbcC|uniref:AAA family ATPase n=1 Tax=Acidiplasma aeolicum TaxID=507754 RepID=UPI00371D81F3
MIIESIHLKNFLSHEDSEINFDPGINIITGKNGAGKTSILDAMKFALFSDSRNNEKNIEMIKKGKKNAEVTITFRINNDEYEIFRSLGIKGSKNLERLSYAKKNGLLIAETYEGVTSEISKILNVSKDVFKNSVFVEQGQMDSLISGTPKERKQVFSDIIGLTLLSKNADKIGKIIGMLRSESEQYLSSELKIDTYKENIKNLENENQNIARELEEMKNAELALKEELNGLDKNIKELNGLRENIKFYEKRRADIENSIERIKNDINKLNNQLSESANLSMEIKKIEENPYYSMRKIMDEYFIKKRDLEKLQKSISDISSKIETYNKNMENLKAVEQRHKIYERNKKLLDEEKSLMAQNEVNFREYEHMLYRIEQIKNQQKSMVIQLNSLKARLGNINTDNIEEEKLRIGNHMEDLEREKISIKKDVASLNRDNIELQQNINTLQGKSVCPLCGSKLTDDHIKNILNEYNLKRSENFQRLNKLVERNQEIDNELKRLKTVHDTLNSADASAIPALLHDISVMTSERDKLTGEMEAFKPQYDAYKQLEAEVKALEADINAGERAEEEYNRLKGFLESMDINELNKEFNNYNNEVNEIIKNLSDIEGKLNFVPDYNVYNNTYDLQSRLKKLMDDEKLESAIRAKIDMYKQNMESMEEDLNKIIRDLKDQNDRIRLLENDENKYAELRAEYDELSGKINLAIAKMDTNNLQKDHYNLEIKKYSGDYERLKKIRSAIVNLEKIRGAFDVNGIQALIRKDASASITNLTRKYLMSFNLDFDDISIDENFNIKVSQNSMEQTLESLSGGEKTALAIALRLSVAEYVLDRISTVIMDEPTNFLDEDRRNNLKDIIQYSLKGETNIPQMIIITHHSELTSVADNSYEVVKENGTSHVISG